jgi:hypothetical protein
MQAGNLAVQHLKMALQSVQHAGVEPTFDQSLHPIGLRDDPGTARYPAAAAQSSLDIGLQLGDQLCGNVERTRDCTWPMSNLASCGM